MEFLSNTPPTTEATQSNDVVAKQSVKDPPSGNDAAQARLIVFDFATRQTESCVDFLPRRC